MQLENLKLVVINALKKSLEIHDQLGATGEEIVNKNQFGDTAVKADLEAERAVLDYLKSIQFPIRVISEEHGQVDITKSPSLLGILDGIDGSAIYKKARGTGRYSTMFGIFNSLNPSYGDYLVSGMMEHSSKKLFIASKGDGAFFMINDQKFPIKIPKKSVLDIKTRIFIDNHLEIEKEIYRNILSKQFPESCNDTSGSSINYIDVATGKYDSYIEYTKKQNLEKAIAYGLIKESGGIMADVNGNDLGSEKYFEFGQKEEVPVITTSTQNLANQILDQVIRKI